MSILRRATICVLTYGDYLPYFRRCLDSILAHTPPEAISLRLGLNAAPLSVQYASECLGLPSRPLNAGRATDGVRRTSGISSGGLPVQLWDSPVNLYKEPMARRMLWDVPPSTEYVVWFDDDTFVEAGWWPALCELLDRKIDYIGQQWWVDYLPGQTEMIRAQPWYRGVPFDFAKGQPGVYFMTGGFWAVRTERLRQANYPDTECQWKDDKLRQFGGDTLLGEIAHQLNWTQAIHDRHIKINVDLEGRHPAPRRGGIGRQFGADTDVVIH